jgi:hypothetical protein
VSRMGFVKLMRSEKTEALMGDPNAFTLLSVIAYRARRTSAFNLHGLAPGEALLGDHDRYGMSQSQYRTAKKKLQKWGIATFRATPRGTIAKLVGTEVYDINGEPCDNPHDNRVTSRRQADDNLMTTNKNGTMQERQERKEVKANGRLKRFNRSYHEQNSSVGRVVEM